MPFQDSICQIALSEEKESSPYKERSPVRKISYVLFQGVTAAPTKIFKHLCVFEVMSLLKIILHG